MNFTVWQRALLLGLSLAAVSARADSWQFWGEVYPASSTTGTASAKLATDGTNLFYSTLADGIYRASLDDHQFLPIPLTGFPLWDANTNTNGFAVWNLAVAPHGTLLISGSPVNISSNNVTAPSSSYNNTLPVFYWWDETNQLWHPAAVTGKTYPYTASAGNFCVASDGAVWTCSGFATYAYRSTDDGHSFTAIDINAHVPTNYFPIPYSGGLRTFGKAFSIAAGFRNEIVLGTETGGYLHTTNNGQLWTSLDPNFTDTNSVNPLGRIGNSFVTGIDRYGNFLCNNSEMAWSSPASATWYGVRLIGYRPADGSCFNAAQGFPSGYGPSTVLTPPSGTTFCFMNQDYLLQGGIYRSANGRNWTQFNQGSGLDLPFAPGITNAVAAGNCITVLSNVVFIATGNMIFDYDSTPPLVLNRPPVAKPQNINLWQNGFTNLTLAGTDADGDSLNFTITTLPQHGVLSGTPPLVTYTPTNHFTGPDSFSFTVDDGQAVSAPAAVNLAVNPTTNTLATLALVSPADGSVLIAPSNLVLTATASAPAGIRSVNFYSGSTILGVATNAPYVLVVTNPAPGDYTFSARSIDNLSGRTWSAPITVSVLPASPALTMQPAAPAQVALSWPLELDGFFLQGAPSPAGPWTFCPTPPLYFSSGQTAVVPATDQQFFRLMHPR